MTLKSLRPSRRTLWLVLRPAILCFAALLSAAASARADEIAVWNFNDSNLTVDRGVGILTTNFVAANVLFTSAGSTVNARMGDAAGQGLTLQGGTSTANNERNLTINAGTAGFSNIVVTLAIQRTTTGFNSDQFQYSLDGVTFINFDAAFTPPAAFGLMTFDLSGISGLNNNPLAAFRIVFNGATAANGNNRLDNLVVEGTSAAAPAAVPEPAALTLLGAGLAGLASAIRRRRR